MLKKIVYHDQVGFLPRIQDWLNIHKSINVILCINRLGNKNYMIISIMQKKHLTTSILKIKNFQQTRKKREVPQPDKQHWWKSITNIFNGERMNVLPKVRNNIRMSALTISISCKRHSDWEGRSKTFFILLSLWKILHNLQKVLELSEFSKVVGYKINMHRSIIYLHSSNEKWEIKKNLNTIYHSIVNVKFVGKI